MATQTATERERIAKYEAWAMRLEQTRASYVRRTPLYQRAFVAFCALGLACFGFGVFTGIWGTGCTLLISLGGYAMMKTRIWELTKELDDTRREIARLRSAPG